jgi:hypothetical protein
MPERRHSLDYAIEERTPGTEFAKLLGQGVLGFLVLGLILTIAANIAVWHERDYPFWGTLLVVGGVPVLLVTLVAHRLFRWRGFTYGVVIGAFFSVAVGWISSWN